MPEPSASFGLLSLAAAELVDPVALVDQELDALTIDVRPADRELIGPISVIDPLGSGVPWHASPFQVVPFAQ